LQQLQQQYQQQQQQHQSLLRAQRAQHQQQLQAGQQEARYQSLVAQQQLLQLQQQQHQVMLQQMTGLPGQMAALGYEPSSAGTLDAGSSVQSSSIASLQSSVVMAGGSSATLRTNIPTGTMDPLWSLPAGTLVLQGDSGSCDLSSSVTALPSVLRQPPGYAGRRPSGDLAAAAAAAAAAAGSELAPAAGLEEMVGSGGSASGLRLQLPPTGLGAAGGVSAATANLMALMGQDAPGQGLYLQGQGGAGEL
jgi:hypothetical protein